MPAARLIFSTGSLHVLDTAQCFALAAEFGFDGVEVMCDQRWSTRDPDYLRALVARHGLPVLAVHTPFSPGVPGWDSADELGRIRRSLRLAEALGAEVLVVHLPLRIGVARFQTRRFSVFLPWGNPFAPVKAWMVDGLAQAQDGTGVKIAIENMPVVRALGRAANPVWWNTVGEWSRVHRWLTLDTTHWGTHGIDPLDAYRAAKERVCHIHLSNFDGREHRLPHRGRLDLAAFLRALKADGFGGTVCLELDPQPLQFHDSAALRRNLAESVAFCREHLG